MSPTKAEMLVQAFAGWGKGEPANMAEILDPDCELIVPDSIPYGFIDAGDQIVVPVNVKAKAKNEPS